MKRSIVVIFIGIVLMCISILLGTIQNDSVVDMDKVVGFSATEYGLQLYFDDGTGYYIERTGNDF